MVSIKLRYFILPIVIALLAFMANSVKGDNDPSFNMRLNDTGQFNFTCLTSDYQYCSSTTKIVMSVYKKDNLVLSNISLTGNPTYFNGSLPVNQLGVYRVLVFANNSKSEFSYKVTYTGTDPNLVQGLIYIGGLVMVILMFMVSAWATMKIPFKNKKDNIGRVLSVNYLKNLKIFLFFVSWLLLTLIFWFAWTISVAFLDVNSGYNLFRFIYLTSWFLIKISTPIIAVFWIIWFLQDKKLEQMIGRGLRPR